LKSSPPVLGSIRSNQSADLTPQESHSLQACGSFFADAAESNGFHCMQIGIVSARCFGKTIVPLSPLFTGHPYSQGEILFRILDSPLFASANSGLRPSYVQTVDSSIDATSREPNLQARGSTPAAACWLCVGLI
jgi:hypothetical protein